RRAGRVVRVGVAAGLRFCDGGHERRFVPGPARLDPQAFKLSVRVVRHLVPPGPGERARALRAAGDTGIGVLPVPAPASTLGPVHGPPFPATGKMLPLGTHPLASSAPW